MKAALLHEAFRTLPIGTLDDIAPGTALIIAPHPDDESLGCGGFIAEACRNNRPPIIVIATDGSASHPNSRLWPPQRLAARRERETYAATAKLGLPASRLIFLRLPDTKAPTQGPAFDYAVITLAHIARDHACQTILVPWRHDPHCDHEAVWLMGLALRAQTGLALRAYPVWGWTRAPEEELDDPPPTGWRLPIEAHLPAKKAAIAAHESQTGHLIQDDPTGFTLPPTLLTPMLRPYEVFLTP